MHKRLSVLAAVLLSTLAATALARDTRPAAKPAPAKPAAPNAAAPAPAPAPNAAAAKAEGLLLGLRTAKGDLQTWFVDGKTAQKLGDGLAVPRRDGWAVLRLVSGTDGKSKREMVWIAKPGAKLVEPPRIEAGCQQDENVDVTFASGDWIGTDRQLSAMCEGAAHPTAERQVIFRAATGAPAEASPPIGGILGDEAVLAMTDAWQEGRKKLAQGNPECLAEDTDFNSWTLVRLRGTWGARILIPRTSEACRGLEGVHDFDLAVPAKIGGSADATKEQIVAAGGNSDVIPSPSGAYTIAVNPQSIRILQGNKTVTKLAGGGTVVLTQWSLGKHVERWRKEAGEALAKKPAR